MSAAQPVIKRLDHLGLIAAFCHEIGLPGIIDRVIPKYSDHNVSHGDAVLAMILNGLGFHSRTLHMFSDFFETKPVGGSKRESQKIPSFRMMKIQSTPRLT